MKLALFLSLSVLGLVKVGGTSNLRHDTEVKANQESSQIQSKAKSTYDAISDTAIPVVAASPFSVRRRHLTNCGNGQDKLEKCLNSPATTRHVKVVFNGSIGFGRTTSLVVPRVGDLLNKSYLTMRFPSISAPEGHYVKWVENVGHYVIESFEVLIGGQTIDKHYGEWLDILADLEGRKKGIQFDRMSEMNTFKTTHEEQTLYIPLKFWFDEDSLPLVALQYHEIRFTVSFRSFDKLTVLADESFATPSQGNLFSSITPEFDAFLVLKYGFLKDTSERSKIASSPHDYLIKQLQFTGEETFLARSTSVELNFNHHVAYLVFTLQLQEYADLNQVLNFGALSEEEVDTGDDGHILQSALLQFNGHDRIARQDYNFFSDVQNMEYFPDSSNPYIYKFSFEFYPGDNGFENFSDIDNVSLELTLNPNVDGKDVILRTYAVSYNILSVESGLASLEF